MALISPFQATLYNPQKISNLSDVITPPYDNIPKGEEKKYWERSPYNFGHIILPKETHENYELSAALLSKWKEFGITKRTEGRVFYIYRQKFEALGVSHSRDTLMCTVGLVDFSKAVVRPHENTYGQFKADRLEILRRTKHQLSHIFAMVRDREGFLKNFFERYEYREPVCRCTGDDGVENTLWEIPERQGQTIVDFFRERPIYIVDGHHRYESALAYARELGADEKWEHPAAHMLFCIANAYDPALVVFPTHRAVLGTLPGQCNLSAIESLFDMERIQPDGLLSFVKKSTPTPQFGLWLKGSLYLCRPKNWRAEAENLGKSVHVLSVVWSDHFLLKQFCGIDDSNRSQKIQYEKDAQSLWNRRENHEAVVFHAPPTMDNIMDVADEKKFMPQKSTFFYPKLAAGLVFREVI